MKEQVQEKQKSRKKRKARKTNLGPSPLCHPTDWNREEIGMDSAKKPNYISHFG